MHEVSLVHALFDQVDRAIVPHPAQAVREVKVRIGELAGVDAALFQTAFDGCREERGYGPASLEILHQRAQFRCMQCGTSIAQGEPLACTSCGGTVRLVCGGELTLERLELEVPDV